MFKAIKNNITAEGFLFPILVREIIDVEGAYYEIIDGEHRYKILKELDKEIAPCIIMKSDQKYAMIETIAMNKFRGEADILKLGNIMSDLLKRYSMQELQDKLGYTEDEILQYQRYVNYNMDDLNIEQPEIKDIVSTKIETEKPIETNYIKYEIMLLKEDYDQIIDVINDLKLKYKVDTAEAITLAAKYFITNKK